MPPVRRLTTILAADVAGYSRLMGADEEGTHERLKAHLRELVNPKIEEHRGRIVKNTGDGLLAEFASVVDAVRCAAEIQRGMIDRELGLSNERRIRFRIGVNLGDVIAEEHDIFGDGVNVAARLEALAEPGGICVSRVVRDQVRDKLDFVFEDRGEQSVKNIARPVRVYAWRLGGAAGLPKTSVPIAVPMRRRRLILAPIGAAVATALVIAIVTWWLWPATRSPSTPPSAVAAAAATASIAQPLVAPAFVDCRAALRQSQRRPRPAILRQRDHQGLTTDRSRLAHMFVISSNTALTYRAKPASTKEIGRELGVRYVLEGSVRRSGNQVRVNVQLINAETDAHLWAERFDRDMGDLFAVQNEITARIAIAINIELVAAEVARPTEHPDALDYILHARAVSAQPPIPSSFAEIIDWLERALTLEPRSTEVQSGLAVALAGRVLASMTYSAGADIERAKALSEQASAAAPRSPFAHFAKGQVLRAQRDTRRPFLNTRRRLRPISTGSTHPTLSASASSSPGRSRRRSRSSSELSGSAPVILPSGFGTMASG
jgi:class 3 adenylate cyclase/TolB-like protein